MKKLLSCVLIFSVTVCFFAKTKKSSSKSAKKSAPQAETPIPSEAAAPKSEKRQAEPSGIALFRAAYPDVTFDASFDSEKDDWKIVITSPIRPADSPAPQSEKDDTRVGTFYWAGGRILPEDELLNVDKYWTLLYDYPKILSDPADFSAEEVERMKQFGSSDNRKNGAGSPMFFFDFIYAAKSREIIEWHIVTSRFLGLRTRIHERIKAPLERVEKEISERAKTDSEVRAFVGSLKSSDAYHWRIIAGTSRRSFHSYGIAVDVLPKSLGGKAIFWSWEKDRNPDGWMVLPLSKRWTPPAAVIEIFEREGFIWGGKWGVWDNMHFEYHPELILHNFGMDAMK